MVAATSVDNKPWLVQKYGGTSLGKLTDTICGSIIPSYTEDNRLVIVCSALSGTLKAKGTTSLLLECIALSERGVDAQEQMINLVNLIRDNHVAALDSIFETQKEPVFEAYDITKTEIVRECEGLKRFLIAAQGTLAKPVILDDVVSAAFGASADDQAAALNRLGSKFYHVIAEEIATRIQDCEPAIPIVTGKFCHSALQHFDLLTMDRVLWYNAELAHSNRRPRLLGPLRSDVCCGNPRKIPSAQLLPSVTADEATELTYYGSEIREANISLRLKNVFKPHAEGTLIDLKSTSALEIGEARKVISPPGVLLKNDFSVGRFERRRPTAVTVKDDILVVNVICNRNTKSGGLLIQVFERLERNNIAVDLIATSERNVSLAVHSPGNSSAVLRLKEELESFGQVAIVKDMSIVTIIGHKMRSQIGVASTGSSASTEATGHTNTYADETLSALAAANVNIHLISQGASEISISLVVNAHDATAALNAIHRDVLKIPTIEESRFRRRVIMNISGYEDKTGDVGLVMPRLIQLATLTAQSNFKFQSPKAEQSTLAEMNTKRVALVVGASRGIGRQVAIDLALAKDGYCVVVAAKSTSDARSASPFPPDPNSPQSTISTVEREIREAGGEATTMAVDVRDFDSVKRCVDKTVEIYGRLDVLVYNSGAIWWAAVEDTPMKRFQLMQRVNPEGLYGSIQASLPHLKKHGSGRIIVAIESGATRKLTLENPKEADNLRKPTIFSDAILAMLQAPAPTINGRLELDEDYLRSDAGVTDFSKYSVIPGTSPRRIMPAQLPDLSVKEQDDEGKRINSAESRSKL
ncbi:hypothetical protein CHU98_g2941 [Xylaria longipes]|nr:hypothetical protein CHU98_g2941 [Xylaria longipes]